MYSITQETKPVKTKTMSFLGGYSFLMFGIGEIPKDKNQTEKRRKLIKKRKISFPISRIFLILFWENTNKRENKLKMEAHIRGGGYLSGCKRAFLVGDSNCGKLPY